MLVRAAAMHQPHIVTIGLDRLTLRAVTADLPHARIQRLRMLPSGTRHGACPTPDLVLLRLSATSASDRAAVWQVWGEHVPVVEVDDQEPQARIWRERRLVQVVPLEPGFLGPLLPRSGMPQTDEPQLLSV